MRNAVMALALMNWRLAGVGTAGAFCGALTTAWLEAHPGRRSTCTRGAAG